MNFAGLFGKSGAGLAVAFATLLSAGCGDNDLGTADDDAGGGGFDAGSGIDASVTIDAAVPMPTVGFQTDVSTTGSEAAVAFDVTVELSTNVALAEALSVDVSDAGTGTATLSDDYTFTSPTTVTFPAGSTSGATQTVSLGIVADTLVEGDETVILGLSNNSSGALGSATHTVTITDDEASVEFSVASSATADESAADSSISVRLSTPIALLQPVTVDVSDLTTGTASSGADYGAFATTTVTFPTGSTDGATQEVTVSVLADTSVEAPETVILGLSNPSEASINTNSEHTLSITDDDFEVSFVAASSSAAEASGDATVLLMLASGAPTTAPITVEVSDAGTGTATSGSDYSTFSTSTVTFPVGSVGGAMQSVTVAVTEDSDIEANETVVLQAANPSGATLVTPTQHTLTILNDDSEVSFQFSASATGEGVATRTIAVNLNTGAPLSAPVSVEVTDLGTGSATSGVDYSAFSDTTVTFPVGANDGDSMNVTVTVTDDMIIEANENVNLGLQSPTGASIVSPSTHNLQIFDNDRTVAFSAATSSVGEGTSTHTVTVTLATGATTTSPITVNVEDLGTGTANSGSDYTAFPDTTVTFPTGSANGATQTVSLSPINDMLVEGNETVILGLTSPSGALVTTPSAQVVTIVDDDIFVSFAAASSASTDESAATQNIAVTLTTGSALTAPVSVTVSDSATGTATRDTDYAAFNSTIVTFPAGSTNGATQNVGVTVIDDDDDEPNETVVLGLGAPSGATITSPSSHTFTITDDDEAPVVRVMYQTDEDTTGIQEVYLFDITNGTAGTVTKLNGALVTGRSVRNSGLSPDGNWAFYIADQNEDEVNELFLVDLSGTPPYSPVRVSGDLTGTNADVERALFSPDSTQLIYRADEDTSNDDAEEIYAVDLATPAAGTKISTTLSAGQEIIANGLRFSPTGRYLFYHVAETFVTKAIRMYDFTTDTDRQLNNALVGAGINGNGAFMNANEDKVIWWGEGEQSGVNELFIVDVSSFPFTQTRIHPSLASADNDVVFALLSPDGNTVAYIGDMNTNSKFEIYAADIGGATPGTPQLITPAAAIAAMNAQAGSIAFSNDSSTVAYHADAEFDNRFEAYIADVNDLTSTVTPTKLHSTLANDRRVSAISLFTPDDSSIIINGDLGTNNDAFELYAFPVATAPTSPASARVSQAMPVDRDVLVNSLNPLLSEDGSLFFFTSDFDTDGVREHWVRDLSDPTATPQKVNGTLASGSVSTTPILSIFNGEQILYVARETSAGRLDLILATLTDPTDSTTFTRSVVGFGSSLNFVYVVEM